MTIFGKHLWHSWTKKTIHYTYNDCMWSNGYQEYRWCKECGLVETRREPRGNKFDIDWKKCDLSIEYLENAPASIIT